MDLKRFLMTAIVIISAGIAAHDPGMAQSQPLPTSLEEEVIVKTSLLTLNDANLTGNYDVMHAKMAKPFRDKFDSNTLKRAFSAFAGKHIDLIAAKPIVPASEASINSNGSLILRGYFDTTPSRLSYELGYAMSEGEWKLINIDVKVKGESVVSDAGGIGLLMRSTADLSGSAK